MGWLCTMNSIKRKVLIVLLLLINVNQFVNTLPSSKTTTNHNDGVSKINQTSSSSTSTTVTVSTSSNDKGPSARHESSTAKISTERLRASIDRNETMSTRVTLLPSSSSSTHPTTSPNSTVIASRRTIASGRIRDNKLMSVLNARRRASNRLRMTTNDDECERQCQVNNSSAETCRIKCNRELKLLRYANSSNPLPSPSAIQHESSTVESNVIVHSSNDEFLDTEESVHGLYFTNPSGSNTTNNDNNKTKAKESSNLISSNGSVKKEIKDLKTLPPITTESSTISSTLKQILSRRNKNLRTSLPPSGRSTMYRGRVKYSPTNFEPLEEIEDPYLLVGQQRLASTTSRNPEVKRQLGTSSSNSRRRPSQYQSTTPSRSKEEELEIMEVSVAKQSSTEKTKFWKSRNIVAINNYMRRLSPTAVTRPPLQLAETSSTSTNSPAATTSSSAPLSTTKATNKLLQYKTISKRPSRVEAAADERRGEGQMATSIAAVNNLAEGSAVDDVKSVFVRNADVDERVRNESDTTTSRVDIAKIPSHRRHPSLPSLIINVPDDATPVFFNDERHYQQSDGEIERERVGRIATTSQTFPETQQTTISSSTTTSVVKLSTEAPSTIQQQVKTTKRIYTTIPRRKVTTTAFPVSNKTTLSTFLKNVATRTQSSFTANGEPITSSTRSIISSTIASIQSITRPEISSSTTTSPPDVATDDEGFNAKTLRPVVLETVAPPSVTPVVSIISTTMSTTNVFIKGVPATLKPSTNDVLIEMQSVNLATLVMAALGLLPLVAILIYVIRQYVYKNELKNSSDIGNYGNDIQPISPVVILDQSSDDGGSIDGADSFISVPEFDRTNLRFQSLLGEGNFGQVWKAEADSLPGYTGTTRIVAVKTERSDNGQGGLKAECEIMRKLGSHTNVVTLLAACVDQEPHLLIMEYAMRGRLLSLLRAARGNLNGSLHHPPPARQPVMPLSPRRLTGFALDIARGMEYIAEKKIVHRDLAARNVLLDHNGICKICDFGMSIDLDSAKSNHQGQMKIPRVSSYQQKFKFDMTARVFGGLKNYAAKSRNDCDQNKNRPALPIRWMAPESLQYHVYSIETDVFAFGIVLWELATLGITPYPTLSGREVIRGVPNGIRPEIPSNCRPELVDAMTNCWHKDPNKRPTFAGSRKNLSRALMQWQEDVTTDHSDYIDVSGFSEDYENGMIYFNRRVSEFECEI